MSAEPDVPVPMPAKYGAPGCPECGYKCGCCCYCQCQTPCPTGEYKDEWEYWHGDDCETRCHGGHEPWDCLDWSTRYRWAKEKSKRLEEEQNGN